MVESVVELREEIDTKHTNILGEGRIKLNYGHSRQRAHYWRLIGEEWIQTGLLPADPESIAKYFSKGFKGRCPTVMPKNGGGNNGSESFICPDCGFVAASKFGLSVHQRKHK